MNLIRFDGNRSLRNLKFYFEIEIFRQYKVSVLVGGLNYYFYFINAKESKAFKSVLTGIVKVFFFPFCVKTAIIVQKDSETHPQVYIQSLKHYSKLRTIYYYHYRHSQL